MGEMGGYAWICLKGIIVNLTAIDVVTIAPMTAHQKSLGDLSIVKGNIRAATISNNWQKPNCWNVALACRKFSMFLAANKRNTAAVPNWVTFKQAETKVLMNIKH
jgi:hypothetical protein